MPLKGPETLREMEVTIEAANRAAGRGAEGGSDGRDSVAAPSDAGPSSGISTEQAWPGEPDGRTSPLGALARKCRRIPNQEGIPPPGWRGGQRPGAGATLRSRGAKMQTSAGTIQTIPRRVSVHGQASEAPTRERRKMLRVSWEGAGGDGPAGEEGVASFQRAWFRPPRGPWGPYHEEEPYGDWDEDEPFRMGP